MLHSIRIGWGTRDSLVEGTSRAEQTYLKLPPDMEPKPKGQRRCGARVDETCSGLGCVIRADFNGYWHGVLRLHLWEL